jgi:hypothetical protein
LLHYDKYLDFRNSHSIYRYSDHLISELYVVSTEFWEVLDFIFARSFSNAITQYFKSNDYAVIVRTLLDDLGIAIKAIKLIFPDTDFPQEEAIKVMAHVCTEFPTIIIREFGAQAGMITGSLGLDKPATETELSEEWFGKLHEHSIIEMNRKLKLLKED